jgi:hypothetical protein
LQSLLQKKLTAFSEVRENLEVEDECRVLQEKKEAEASGRKRKDGSKATSQQRLLSLATVTSCMYCTIEATDV